MSGTREKMILNGSKTRDSTCSNQPLLKERRKLKKSMLKELRRSDLKRLRLRKEH